MSVVEKKFNNGEIIVKEGDVGSNFFKIIEGKAYVISNYEKKDQLQLAILEEGAYFGEMGILEEYPRSATIIAKGPTRVLEILKDDLTDYFTDRPDQIFVIMKLLAGRVQAMENDYNDAQNLLKTLKASDATKKQSLFSKIKKPRFTESEYIRAQEKAHSGFKTRVFGAMRRANVDGWGGKTYVRELSMDNPETNGKPERFHMLEREIARRLREGQYADLGN